MLYPPDTNPAHALYQRWLQGHHEQMESSPHLGRYFDSTYEHHHLDKLRLKADDNLPNWYHHTTERWWGQANRAWFAAPWLSHTMYVAMVGLDVLDRPVFSMGNRKGSTLRPCFLLDADGRFRVHVGTTGMRAYLRQGTFLQYGYYSGRHTVQAINWMVRDHANDHESWSATRDWRTHRSMVSEADLSLSWLAVVPDAAAATGKHPRWRIDVAPSQCPPGAVTSDSESHQHERCVKVLDGERAHMARIDHRLAARWRRLENKDRRASGLASMSVRPATLQNANQTLDPQTSVALLAAAFDLDAPAKLTLGSTRPTEAQKEHA